MSKYSGVSASDIHVGCCGPQYYQDLTWYQDVWRVYYHMAGKDKVVDLFVCLEGQGVKK